MANSNIDPSGYPISGSRAPRTARSRPSQTHRHLDGVSSDWRTATPGRPTPVKHPLRSRARHVVVAIRSVLEFENILLGPQGNRRDLCIFVVGMAWGVMCAIGFMAARGVHP